MSARRDSGFALLLVLLVLAICGTILAATARRCVNDSLRAASAQRRIQLRWGALSCRESVLPAAERLLREQQANGDLTAAEVRRSITLGGMKLNLIVADEMAKANVNMLAARGSEEELIACISRLQAEASHPLAVLLRPLEGIATGDRDDPWDEPPTLYAAFDQVLQIGHPSQLASPSSGDVSPARRRITFWGSGRVNLQRAELPVLREILGDTLSESQLAMLDEFRRREPDFTVDDAFAHLQLTDDEIEAVDPLATDESDCHSLWVIVEGKTRNWYRLYVEDPENFETDLQALSFVW